MVTTAITLVKALMKVKYGMPGSENHSGSTSNILREFTQLDAETITIGDVSAQLGERGFGILLLLLALPNTIPLPIPGMSTITGLPLIFLAGQRMLGKERIWMPRWIADRQIPTGGLRASIEKILPWLMKLENVVRPRFEVLTTGKYERFAATLIFILAALIALPVPFGNLPLGIAMAVLALAICERDGIVMITGWLFAIIGLCFFAALIHGYAWVWWQLVSGFF